MVKKSVYSSEYENLIYVIKYCDGEKNQSLDFDGLEFCLCIYVCAPR
jgi:hypothetical protein